MSPKSMLSFLLVLTGQTAFTVTQLGQDFTNSININQINYIYVLQIKNRSESDLRNYEATKAVAEKARTIFFFYILM